MFRHAKKNMLSTVVKILLYGGVNFALVLTLIPIAQYKIGGAIEGQLVPIAIIVTVTGLVNYMMVNSKY